MISKDLEVDGVNKIWRDARLKGAGLKRAKTLVTAAEHSIGNTEAPRSARKEIRNLLNDYERSIRAVWMNLWKR